MQRGTPGYIAPELRGLDENDELSSSMGKLIPQISTTEDQLQP